MEVIVCEVFVKVAFVSIYNTKIFTGRTLFLSLMKVKLSQAPNLKNFPQQKHS